MSTTTSTPVPASLAALPPADGQTPAVRPGHRLMPALIGTINRAHVVHIECPDWCTDDHMDEPHGLEEVTHNAGDKDVEVVSIDDLTALALHWTARISAYPASPFAQARAAHIVVDDEGTEARLTPEMAEELADDLVAFTAYLRQLAGTVRAANAAVGDLTSWTSLTRIDLQSMPVADLIRAFGVTVRESTEVSDEYSVVLGGEPGEMLLLVHPTTPQNVREYETRKALLAWHDAQLGGDRD
ncbi:MAG: hypothetical protein HOY79_07435 [Streptomyces sp.]|nr:hypothetical protein [Streptomyces sp.]NUS13345.1 hypothetical protein [Streptomyces sp.]